MSSEAEIPSLEDISSIHVQCSRGLAPICFKELEALGLDPIRHDFSGVWLTGNILRCMELNLRCRTGTRVLFLLKEGQAANLDELYDALVAMPWEKWLPNDGYLSVDGVVRHPTIRDYRVANQTCKDAIVDRIREQTGQRPDSGPEKSGCCVFLHWTHEGWAMYIDTTGEPMGRRGYRLQSWKAPLPENLAAALLIESGYDGTQPLINPFCGSGTFIIEGAMIAGRIPPGIKRTNYAFMHLHGYDEPTWRQIRAEAKQLMRPKEEWPSLMASDLDPDAITQARSNAKRAGMRDDEILFDAHDFSEQDLPVDAGLIVMNPPYGMRLGDPGDIKMLYKRIGHWIRDDAMSWNVGMLLEDPNLLNAIALKGVSMPVRNGRTELGWWQKKDDAPDFGLPSRDRRGGTPTLEEEDADDQDVRPRTRVRRYDDERFPRERSHRQRGSIPPFKKRAEDRRSGPSSNDHD